MFRHTYSINQIETILAKCVWSDVAQLFITDSTHSTPLHLNIKRKGFYITHKHYYFQWLYICSGSNQRASHCYTEILVVTELAYQFVAITCRIGDFLNKSVIRSSKHLFSYLHNIGSVDFIKSKYQRLRQIIHIRLTLRVIEEFGINHIPISRKNQLYLCRIDNTPIKFFIGVGLGLLAAHGLDLTRISRFFLYFLTL